MRILVKVGTLRLFLLSVETEAITMSAAVKEFPISAKQTMPTNPEEIKARTVIQLPESLRSALRIVAYKRGIDMGDVVADALQADPEVRAVHEDILKSQDDEKKKRGK